MSNHCAVGYGLLLAAFALSETAAGQALELDMDSAPSLGRAGAKVSGAVEFVEGRKGQAARLAGGAHVRLEPGTALTAREGTVDLWVKPAWEGRDPARHAFFHTGGGDSHITVFAAGGKLLFVYKGNRRAWHGTSANIAHWRKDTWHRVRAGWRPAAGGGLACLLEVDGRTSASSGATPLDAMPSQVLIGARGAAEPADAVLDEVRLSPVFTPPTLPEPRATTIDLSLDASKPAGPMPRTWSFVTPWNSRSYRIPFTQTHPYFRRFQEAGFDMVRMVAFSENWLWGTEVTRGADGRLALDFSDFDAMVDLYRSAGAEPYIRLAYHMPSVMSSATGGEGKARSYSLPRDMDEWCDFMRRIVRHCNVERKLGIRYWVAMLNEADIPIRRGEASWEPMLELYARTVQAVREVDPAAKVGGPATCGPLPGVQEDGIRRFVRFCKARNLPPDFLCFHQYGKPHPRDYERSIQAARDIVQSEWPGLEPEYFLDEWSLWARDKTQDNEFGAAYLAAAIHYQVRAGLTRSSIVSFNTAFPPDEVNGASETFRGPLRKAAGRTARFYAAEQTLGDRTLPCLHTHSVPAGGSPDVPYTFGRYTVRVPDGATLRTATAVAIDHADADGVGMGIRVRDGATETTVLAEHVRATTWRDHVIPLAAFAGREVTIEFRTDCGGPGANTVADHGLWGDPRIEVGGKRVVDFCTKVGEATTGWVAPRQWHTLGTKLPMIKGNVVTPVYFTYWLYNRLRGQRLAVALPGRAGIHEADVAGALACRDGQTVRVLLWHFDGDRAALSQHFDVEGVRIARTMRLRVAGLPPRCRVTRYLIDRDHSNAYTDYVLKNKPDNDGEYNLRTGTVDIVEDRPHGTDGGELRLDVKLDNLSVSLIEIEPS